MKPNDKLNKLKEEKIITVYEPDSSLSPIIRQYQKHILMYVNYNEIIDLVDVGDLVCCRFNKKIINAIISKKVKMREGIAHFEIINGKKQILGWTGTIYGKIIKILN